MLNSLTVANWDSVHHMTTPYHKFEYQLILEYSCITDIKLKTLIGVDYVSDKILKYLEKS